MAVNRSSSSISATDPLSADAIINRHKEGLTSSQVTAFDAQLSHHFRQLALDSLEPLAPDILNTICTHIHNTVKLPTDSIGAQSEFEVSSYEKEILPEEKKKKKTDFKLDFSFTKDLDNLKSPRKSSLFSPGRKERKTEKAVEDTPATRPLQTSQQAEAQEVERIITCLANELSLEDKHKFLKDIATFQKEGWDERSFSEKQTYIKNTCAHYMFSSRSPEAQKRKDIREIIGREIEAALLRKEEEPVSQEESLTSPRRKLPTIDMSKLKISKKFEKITSPRKTKTTDTDPQDPQPLSSTSKKSEKEKNKTKTGLGTLSPRGEKVSVEKKARKAENEQIKHLRQMSDDVLRNYGFTPQQIVAFRTSPLILIPVRPGLVSILPLYFRDVAEEAKREKPKVMQCIDELKELDDNALENKHKMSKEEIAALRNSEKPQLPPSYQERFPYTFLYYEN